MKEVKHAYSNICKEEKYINDMLNNGYKLSRIEGTNVYFLTNAKDSSMFVK